jgi:DNA-binding transcriptional LysR family regulator
MPNRHRWFLFPAGLEAARWAAARKQALAFCGAAADDAPARLGATSLTTVMQMVANGYGVTLLPETAAEVEVRDGRVKLLRFADPQPARTIGLAWRRTSARKQDFAALGEIVAKQLSRPATCWRSESVQWTPQRDVALPLR